MRRVEQLLEAIAAAPRARRGDARVIAIDGRSGAGKSTLAAALAGRVPAALVALEDLYGGWDGLQDGVGRLCGDVLSPFAQGRAARVPRYDWGAGAWLEPRTLEPPEILIVEGVGAGALAAAPYTSLLAWVQAPAALRLERALTAGRAMRTRGSAGRARRTPTSSANVRRSGPISWSSPPRCEAQRSGLIAPGR